MAAIDRTNDAMTEGADRLASADLVRLAVPPTADSIAATGILTRALAERGIPHHASISPTGSIADPHDAHCVAVGAARNPGVDACLRPGSATVSVAEQVRSLGQDPHPELLAAGSLFSRPDVVAADRGATRTAGVGVAVADVADGLAHATLVHGPFSGDPALAAAWLGEVDEEDGRRLGSAVALSTIAEAGAAPRVPYMIERFIHPIRTANAPFETAAGTADVLDVVAACDPGLALAVACGQRTARGAALEAWRAASERIHRTIRAAEPEPHTGIDILRVSNVCAAPLARLSLDVLTTQPTVAVLTEDRVAVASIERDGGDLVGLIENHASEVIQHGEGRVSGTYDGPQRAMIAELVEGAA